MPTPSTIHPVRRPWAVWAIATILAAVLASPCLAADRSSNRYFQQMKPVLGRGINLGNALEAPAEGQWGVTLKEEYFEAIRAAGFDSIRLPVRWSAHADAGPPYRIDPKFFARVDWALQQSLKRRLMPVLNMHHYDELTDQPDKHHARFLALWKQIAEHYQDYPSALTLELLNEPHGNLTAEKWNALLAEAIPVVRRTNEFRSIVVGPVGWNSIDDLKHLVLPKEDRHLIVTVHYYNPFHFTHQGASWAGPEASKWLGTQWLGTPAEQQAVSTDLEKAIAWAIEQRRPIYLGEFGSYDKADLDSRARWTRCVVQQALKRKMSFAYWEFCSGFGAYDSAKNRWIEPLKAALMTPLPE